MTAGWPAILAFCIGLIGLGEAWAAGAIQPRNQLSWTPWAAIERARFKGDLSAMVRRGAIRVLVAYNRTQFFLDKGQAGGLTYEYMHDFELWLNKRLDKRRPRVTVYFIPVPRDQLLPALRDGRGDIAAANLTVTPERQALVDFSSPYITEVREIVVTGPAAPPLSSLDDLAGLEVLVRPSSSYHASLTALNARLKAAKLEPVQLTAVDEHLEDDDLLEMVNAGVIPFAVVDDFKARLWAQVLPDIKPREDLLLREGGGIAFAMRKNSPQLKRTLDEFVARTGRGTEFGNVVFRRYFEDVEFLKNAAAERDRERFRKLVDLFRRYGERYGLDPLMLAAQGYQESRLDQTARSPAGAVGVMQLRPQTARDPSIGIPNIHLVENNIHAGAKYLRFLTDTYFADPAINATNRVLFAFAAYNAGPTRIATLRTRAVRTPYDDAQWFNHVEVLAGRHIGRETVDYVRNILKYYVVYRRIAHTATIRREALEEIAGDAIPVPEAPPLVHLP